MKNRGVILAIMLILIMGAGVTVGTRRFISDKTSGSSPASFFQAPAAESGIDDITMAAAGLHSLPVIQDGAANGETVKEKDEEPGSFAQEEIMDGQTMEEAVKEDTVSTIGGTAADTGEGPSLYSVSAGEEEAVPESMRRMAAAAADSSESREESLVNEKSSVAISPLTGVSESGEVITESASTLEDYIKKLNEIDSLIENLQSADSGSNTDSLRNVADYEYRLWDVQLNHIYQSILERMTDGEAESLRSEERKWIESRDLTAKKAAAKYGGGTMESLEYTASLAASTRSRAYELLENYGSFLE